MSAGVPVPLVPGELRGYRQFLLLEDGLYPVVHWAAGPWAQGWRDAACSVGGEHAAPDRGCTCGFYGWYDPSGMSGAYGGVRAVVAVAGRVVLGDAGFRAGRGRVVAMTLPVPLRWHPRATARVRAMLAARYPDVQVYRSMRQMLRDHPPDDLSNLGIGPVDRAPARCRRAALWLWALFVLAGYGVLLLPRERVAEIAAGWWPLLVAAVLAWQAAMVTLVVRSQPPAAAPGSGPGEAGTSDDNRAGAGPDA